jgi:S1-C subfamily serine protease
MDGGDFDEVPEATAEPAPPPWPSAPPARARRRREPSTARTAVVAGLVGALIGGGVAGGVVVAVDGHHDNTTTIIRSSDNQPARASTVLTKPGDIREIVDKVQPAVVRIVVSNGLQSGTGTGFVIASNGLIVTNAHVVDSQREVQVTLNDGDQVRGRVLGQDSTVDLAVVKVDRTGLPTVTLGNSDDLQVGDAVVAIGNALGLSDGTGPTVTSGIVSGLDRTVDVSETETLLNAIQTDAAINPGNSGGPLLDSQGRVIGINTAIANPGSSNNVGFAIAISSAKPIIDDLRVGRQPRIAFLGVKTQTVTPSIAKAHSLRTAAGAYVDEVTPGSGADKAGVNRGDVIVEADGDAITRSDEVLRAVRGHHAGDRITIVLLRGGTRKTVTVTLGTISQAS